MTTQTTNAPDQPTTTEWHWVMTIQAAGGVTNTRTATIRVSNGHTRAQVLDFVLDQFKADYGTPISVLFFDLQPNQL